jgi:hypothetical protein
MRRQSDVLAAMNAKGWQIPNAGVHTDQGFGSSLTAASVADGHLLLLGPARTIGAGEPKPARGLAGVGRS